MSSFAILLLLAQAAPGNGTTAPAPLSAPTGWAERTGESLNTGTRFAAASVYASDGGGRLTVRCDMVKEPIVSVQFIPKVKPGVADPHSVNVKFDAAPAKATNWEFPGPGVLTRDPDNVFALVSGIASAQHIQVLTTDADGAPLSASFDGPGNDAMFRNVYEACGLPYAPPASENAEAEVEP